MSTNEKAPAEEYVEAATDDTEGHRLFRQAAPADDEDVEGHRKFGN